jgi:hypothetical protein
MSVQTKHDIGAMTGVDLADDQWIKQARAKRARAAYEPRVTDEITLLTRRVSWLQRKARRLPLNSNARKAATAQAVALQQLARMLPIALSGRTTVKIIPGPGRHEQRAVALLHELAAIE